MIAVTTPAASSAALLARRSVATHPGARSGLGARVERADTRDLRAVPCPDPSVARVSRSDYRIFCTTATLPNAILIYRSTNLADVEPDGYAYWAGYEPRFCEPTNGTEKGGEIWGPEVVPFRRHGRRIWRLYFACRVASSARLYDAFGRRVHVDPNTMIIVSALNDSSTLSSEDWHDPSIVSFTQKYNCVKRAPKLYIGGEIDPSVAYDTAAHEWMMSATVQPDVIVWYPLTADGAETAGPPRVVGFATRPWQGRVAEGTALYVQGKMLVDLVSYGSTWGDNDDRDPYVIGAIETAASEPIAAPIENDPHPVLKPNDSRGIYNCAGESQPVRAPNGQDVVAAAFTFAPSVPTHNEMLRYLVFVHIDKTGGRSWSLRYRPRVSNARRGSRPPKAIVIQFRWPSFGLADRPRTGGVGVLVDSVHGRLELTHLRAISDY